MEFTGGSQKQESPQANGPLSCKKGKVTFPWVKLVGELSFAKLYVSVCTHGVTLTAGEMILLEFFCRILEVFICEPCDLDRRTLAKELNVDVTKWQLFLEANQKHH